MGAASHGAGVDIDVARQKVIVSLLHESSLSPDVLSAHVLGFIQHKVLTHSVRAEVEALFHAKNLKLPLCTPAIQDKGALDLQPQGPALATPPPGSRFDQEFERLGRLGRGAFGEVWHVRSRVDRHEYAVKVVPFHVGQGEDPLDHPALREAQAWAAVSHPNVVRYHTAWVEVGGGAGDPPAPDGGRQLALPAAEMPGPGGARAWYEESDDSDGPSSKGVVFEASAGSRTNSQRESSAPLQVALPREGRHGVQVAPRSLATSTRLRATLYVQIELVRGGTLREWIDRRNAAFTSGEIKPEARRLWVKRGEDIFRQCVDAVAQLHAQGLLHRDIKPANIFLAEDGGIRLGDFGLVTAADSRQPGAPPRLAQLADVAAPARVATPDADEGGASAHTRGVGTPSYASPEQLRGRRYGAKADVFALGVVLAELLCPVGTQMERAAVVEGLRARRFPSAKGAASQARTMVLAMTSEDPGERPTARELAAWLRERRQASQGDVLM